MSKGRINVSVSLNDTKKFSLDDVLRRVKILTDEELERELLDAKNELDMIESMIIKKGNSARDVVFDLKQAMTSLLDALQQEKERRCKEAS